MRKTLFLVGTRGEGQKSFRAPPKNCCSQHRIPVQVFVWKMTNLPYTLNHVMAIT